MGNQGGQENRPDLAVLMSEIGSGGMGKMRLRLMNAVVAGGYRVDLILGKRHGGHALALDERIRVFDLGTTHAIFGVPRLALYLRRHRPRVLLTQRIRVTVLAHRARWLARLGARPRLETRIYATGNTHESVSVREYPPREQNKRLARLGSHFARNDGMIAVSRGVADDHAHLMGWPPEAIHVAPNPVITPDIDEWAHQPVSHPWFQHERSNVVVAVGRLQPQKDFRTLISAFGHLRQHHDARLVIFGEGHLRPDLENYVDELGLTSYVDFPGFTRNVYAYLARSRLFVLSSAWEGSPNVLVEAMAVDTPVVATDCPSGPAEIVDNGRLAPLVPVGDAGAMAEAMERVWTYPPDPGLLRKSACERFTAERSAAAYLKALGLERSQPDR